MALTTTLRFRPFSHTSGDVCMLCGSSLAFQIFAGRIVVFDYSIKEPAPLATFTISGLGPLDQFCVLQDMEQGKIVVSGFAKGGFVRYTIASTLDSKSWTVTFLKLPAAIHFGDALVSQGKSLTYSYGTSSHRSAIFGPRERLFLGVDKAQEWSQVVRRCQMQEILPYLHWLSQSVAYDGIASEVRAAPSLFTNAQEVVEQKKRVDVVGSLKALFIAGFGSRLVPRLEDSEHHGYLLPVVDSRCQSPLALLQRLFGLVRSLFFQEQAALLTILPLLPPEFSCGTLSDITTSKGHKIALEWTKHTIRRVRIEAACDDELTLSFQKEIKTFRHGSHRFDAPAKLKILAKQTYLLDNFLK